MTATKNVESLQNIVVEKPFDENRIADFFLDKKGNEVYVETSKKHDHKKVQIVDPVNKSSTFMDTSVFIDQKYERVDDLQFRECYLKINGKLFAIVLNINHATIMYNAMKEYYTKKLPKPCFFPATTYFTMSVDTGVIRQEMYLLDKKNKGTFSHVPFN